LGSWEIGDTGVASFGDRALAAHQVGLRVESVSFMVGFGFMIASTVVSGQNFGAGNYRGLQRGISTIAHLTAFTMGLTGIFLLLFPREFFYFFKKFISNLTFLKPNAPT
jgi:Na+-driven multidrug efflux pump